MTLVEERIDHEEAKQIAQHHIRWAENPRRAKWPNRELNEDVILARAYLSLSRASRELREGLAQVRAWTNHIQGCDQPDDSNCPACIADSELARYEEALALPATEPAQPEESDYDRKINAESKH